MDEFLKRIITANQEMIIKNRESVLKIKKQLELRSIKKIIFKLENKLQLLKIKNKLQLLTKVTEELKMALEKPTYRNEVNLDVEKVELRTTGKNKEFLLKVEMHTNNEGFITHKPSKTIKETGTYRGFVTHSEKKELYRIDEFIEKYPFLLELDKNCRKGKSQKLQAGFVEAYNIPTKEEEEKKLFKFFREWHFDEIYYKEFHKDNTENLDKQKERSKLV